MTSNSNPILSHSYLVITGKNVVIFVYWTDREAKDEGKMTLWNIMMATESPVGGSTGASNLSMHTTQNGGLFACDSDRSYSEARLLFPSKSWFF